MTRKPSHTEFSTPTDVPPGIDYAFRGIEKFYPLQHLSRVQASLGDFAKIDLYLIERMGQFVDASTVYHHLSQLGYPHSYQEMLAWIAGRRFPSPAPYLVLSKAHLPPIKGFNFPMILIPNNQRYLDMARNPKGTFVDRTPPSSTHITIGQMRTDFRGRSKKV